MAGTVPDYETILLSVRDDGVAKLSLNRPRVINVFNGVMERELHDAWGRIRVDPDVRVVVLHGEGEKGFCAGWDRRSEGDEALSAVREPNLWARTNVGAVIGPKGNACWKPVVAAVHGIACAGAFYLLGQSDVIIASEDATFFDPHSSFGLAPIFEPILMRHKMPYGEVARMTLLGNDERISAARAYQIGLISEVTAKGAVVARALELAAQIAARPLDTLQAAVFSLWQSQNVGLGTALEYADSIANVSNYVTGGKEETPSFGRASFVVR